MASKKRKRFGRRVFGMRNNLTIKAITWALRKMSYRNGGDGRAVFKKLDNEMRSEILIAVFRKRYGAWAFLGDWGSKDPTEWLIILLAAERLKKISQAHNVAENAKAVIAVIAASRKAWGAHHQKKKI